MSILVVGSVAYDSVETPFGRAERVLGGSATYFSISASFFADVRLMAVVGEDFAEEDADLLRSREIDLTGLARHAGLTFHWQGRYGYDLNEAQTLATHLNVFERFHPQVPAAYRDSDCLVLANIDPELQLEVLRQMGRPPVVACDTMNFWISGKRDALLKVIGEVDFFIINEGEARQLAGEANLVKAARRILEMGVRTLIVKRGEYGVLMFSADGIFAVPAYPLEEVYDPTGAGDTFAGGFMGYLANTGDYSPQGLRQAIVAGSVMASFTVEDFSLQRLKRLTYDEISERFRRFKELTEFSSLETR
jgi:sugar/nucleoside kinase (ribokinase family)